jgi:replicative DNA helicase
MQEVTILKGSYRNKPINDVKCKLLRPIKMGAKGWFGNFEIESLGVVRVQIPSETMIQYHESIDKTPQEQETDEQIIARIEDRFAILDEVTNGVADGEFRSLIVSGAPGIGKSAGISKTLENKKKNDGLEYNIVSGTIVSAYNLYQTLYDNSEINNVLILDDCDSLLYDGTCINLLKAALESGNKPRIVSYKSDSVLQLGIPTSFEFEGRIIFITNMDFQRIIDRDKSAAAKHLAALTDRSLYLDLTLHTKREIWCRIYSMVTKHHMLKQYKFTPIEIIQLLDYVRERQNDFRSFSLRTVIQLAQFMKNSPDNWRRMSDAFQIKR